MQDFDDWCQRLKVNKFCYLHNSCACIETEEGSLVRARDILHFVPDAAFLDASLKQHPSSHLDFSKQQELLDHGGFSSG